MQLRQRQTFTSILVGVSFNTWGTYTISSENLHVCISRLQTICKLWQPSKTKALQPLAHWQHYCTFCVWKISPSFVNFLCIFSLTVLFTGLCLITITVNSCIKVHPSTCVLYTFTVREKSLSGRLLNPGTPQSYWRAFRGESEAFPARHVLFCASSFFYPVGCIPLFTDTQSQHNWIARQANDVWSIFVNW